MQLKGNDCNRQTAYARGSNDSKYGYPMNEDVGDMCPADVQPEVQAGYRDGYEAGNRNQPRQTVVVAAAPAAYVVAPAPSCIEAYGRRACGYDCKEAYGRLACGANPGDNCVEAYGKLRCGQSCRESYGNIICAGD